MLPLFNEDAVLPTRIMVVVPVVKVYVLLVHLLYFFVRCVLCQRDWVGWVIWQRYVHCCGKWNVIVIGRCRFRRL